MKIIWRSERDDNYYKTTMGEKMRVFLILFLAVFAFFLFNETTNAQENLKETERTVVLIILEERKELMPDTLYFNFSISAKSERESDVINMLGLVDKKIRDLKFDYSGGSYSVFKNCWWEKEKRKCMGYIGEVNYQFKLKETKEQNRLLEAVDDIKERYGEKLNYTVSSPQWSISERRIRESQEELKLLIIDSAKLFANKIADKIKRTCMISEINYDTGRLYFEQPVMFKAATMSETRTIEAPEPKRDEKSVIVKAQIRLICIDQKR